MRLRRLIVPALLAAALAAGGLIVRDCGRRHSENVPWTARAEPARIAERRPRLSVASWGRPWEGLSVSRSRGGLMHERTAGSGHSEKRPERRR